MYKSKAQELSYLSRQFAVGKNKDAWLDLFAEDAVVQDPIGISPLDESGNGHKGKKAIAAFYDKTIADSNITFDIIESIPCGEECANFVEISNNINGALLTTKMIVIYRVNSDDKIVSLRAFWEYKELESQLAKLLSVGD
ncbi:MAG: nuclear transport factor 2 family protein [Gammaproteobacteria bacterium]